MVDFIISQSFRQEIEKRMLNACHFSPDNLRALIVLVSEFVTQVTANCAHAEPQFEGLVETQVKKQVQGLLEHWIEQSEPWPLPADCRHRRQLGALRAGAAVEPG